VISIISATDSKRPVGDSTNPVASPGSIARYDGTVAEFASQRRPKAWTWLTPLQCAPT
jgi:hypothetical protein